MSGYCTETDIINRLSLVGLGYLVDQDEDGSYESSDTPIVESVIEDASQEIDVYLARRFNTPRELVGNGWLKARCVDLTVERLFEQKGRQVTDSVAKRAQDTRDWLAEVAVGNLRVPNVTYPGDGFTIHRRKFGLPRVKNPGGK